MTQKTTWKKGTLITLTGLALMAMIAVGCNIDEKPLRTSKNVDDLLTLFADEVQDKGILQACEELSNLCETEQKGCDAYDLFCKANEGNEGAAVGGDEGGEGGEGGAAVGGDEGGEGGEGGAAVGEDEGGEGGEGGAAVGEDEGGEGGEAQNTTTKAQTSHQLEAICTNLKAVCGQGFTQACQIFDQYCH